jgi:uncharacterized tannase-like protein DUF6351
MSRRPQIALSLAVMVGIAAWALTLGQVAAAPSERDAALSITSVSNPHPQLVSGGDLLLRVTVPDGVRLDQVRVTRNGADITSAFAGQTNGTLLGLVTGLREGTNLIAARAGGSGEDTEGAELRVTNHPITGPVFSGRQQLPFFCETQAFGLQPAVQPFCSAPTQVTYLYKTTGGAFNLLTDPTSRPADLAHTTVNGHSVPYIIRLEQGTIDRAVYQMAVLFDGNNPSPLHPDTSWNGRLVYTFGGGCDAGYHQGSSTGGVITDLFLGQGFGVASSTLNVLNNNCSTIISAEAAMMVKEHFIETYGPVQHTIGWGGSGGAIQQYDIADAYPGILDGIIPGVSFPDVTTTLGPVTDCRLLDNFFTANGTLFNTAQMTAISGFGDYTTCKSWDATFANRITATDSCDAAIPVSARYDPVTKPNGVKCSAAEQLVNQLGRNPKTGFVRSTLDNVGVQYGLAALASGAISPEQFVSLNQGIGGYDVAGKPVAQRSQADPRALNAAYSDDLLMSGGLGLATTPIIDQRLDLDFAGFGNDIHTTEWSYVIRQRMIEHGTAANQVIIENYFPTYVAAAAFELNAMERWLSAIDADPSDRSTQTKIVSDKPADLADGCFLATGLFPEPLSYRGTGTCPTQFPVFSNTRLVAGQPLDLAILKCSLMPIRFSAYSVTFTAGQKARLKAAFPQGVCNYSRRGVGERAPRGTWLNYNDVEGMSD